MCERFAPPSTDALAPWCGLMRETVAEDDKDVELPAWQFLTETDTLPVPAAKCGLRSWISTSKTWLTQRLTGIADHSVRMSVRMRQLECQMEALDNEVLRLTHDNETLEIQLRRLTQEMLDLRQENADLADHVAILDNGLLDLHDWQ